MISKNILIHLFYFSIINFFNILNLYFFIINFYINNIIIIKMDGIKKISKIRLNEEYNLCIKSIKN